jgi:regulatory protein
LRWLARREHSSAELHDKLVKKGCVPELAAQVVERLQGERLLSDERFVESLIAARRRRGIGPLRVRQDLERKGISPETVERWLNPSGREWVELVREVWRKKYKAKQPKTHAERAKQARFLQSRGFSFDQIQQVFNGRDTD